MSTNIGIHRFPCLVAEQGKYELICFVADADPFGISFK